MFEPTAFATTTAFASQGAQAAVSWVEVEVGPYDPSSKVSYRAIVWLDGFRRVLPIGMEGTGLKPYVYYNDTIRQQQTNEGVPVIWKNNQYQTLNSDTEQLII